jgi:hypothetical protein
LEDEMIPGWKYQNESEANAQWPIFVLIAHHLSISILVPAHLPCNVPRIAGLSL